MNRGTVARLLARDVANRRYAFEPGEMRTIRARHKTREVFSCRLSDLLVHGVVADLVQEAVAPLLSPRLYSYRKGMAWLTPVSALAAYIRSERRRHADPRDRGIYVLRRDVDSYTDSIPIDAGSPLWPMLEARLGAPLPSLVKESIRTELRLADGAVACRVKGLPMGQPISAVVANLYLGELDRAVEAIPGGFYARYGDDFLFTHSDPEVARGAADTMDRVIASLALTVNEKKKRTLFLTPAGCPSAAWPHAAGASSVPFLGTVVSGDGTVGLDGRKVRSLLHDLERRTKATASTMRGSTREEVGRAVCPVVNRSLDAHRALTQQRSAIILLRVVTDRRQLEQLDYWIARLVVQAVTGSAGVRAFRELPYRSLRRDWGLVSLVAARNRRPRR